MKKIPLFFSVAYVSFSLVSVAWALPKFSLQEKKRCYECHYNRNGGGPLNQKGKYFSRNGSLKNYAEDVQKYAQAKPVIRVAEKKPVLLHKPKVKKEKVKAPPEEEKPVVVSTVEQTFPEETLLSQTSVSGDLVLSYLYSEKRNDPQNFYLVRAEPLITTQVTENFLTVFGYNFAVPVLTAYGQVSRDALYAQLGSFHLPFGIDFLDYNNTAATLIKEHYDLALDTRDVGVEVGYKKDFYARMSLTNGARQPRKRPDPEPEFARDIAVILDAGYQGLFFEVPFLLGMSFLTERRMPPGLPQRGVISDPTTAKRSRTSILEWYGQLNYKKFGMLGEFAFGWNTPVRGDESFGFYVKPYYAFRPNWDFAFRAELFGQERLLLGESRFRMVLSSKYQFSKYVSLEPMYRFNLEFGNHIVDERNNDAMLLLSMKF